MDDYTYCPHCATELELADREPPDPPRPTCPACGFVHYLNPTPTVGGWVDRDGLFLLLRRNQDPKRNCWNTPGGFVEAGESGAEAIAREVLEETALEVEATRVIGIYASKYGDEADAEAILDIAYLCEITGGELEISDESLESEWFPLEEIPELAFKGERMALERLRSS